MPVVPTIQYVQPAPVVATKSNERLFCKVFPKKCPKPPAEVPGPLPIFGAVGAFVWSRKLRARIKNNRS
jgi:hypothetical protein